MSADNDRKIKELMERMVAMAPEPPDYPEEMAVAKPQPETKRRSPALIAALAAAAVLVLAVPLLLLRDDGESPAVTTTVGTVPTTVPSVTTVPTPTTTIPAPVEAGGVVYLIQEPDNSFLGNPALVPFRVTATDTSGLLTEEETSLSLLTKVDDLGAVLPADFQTVIPAGVEVLGVTNEDGIIVVDMNEAFLDGAGGLLADITMLNQLIFTATHDGIISDEEAQVRFTVDGEPIEAYGTEGLMLTDPVGRDSFLDDLNSVIVTEPLVTAGDRLPMIIGLARVFEATVSLQIVDESGTVLYEDFTNASTGAPDWGVFEFSFDTPAFEPGRSIRVFWHSPEDGEPTDVVTVPILEDPEGVWDLTP